MRAHRKICRDCDQAKTNPYAYCDQGWDMAKRESRAAYRLRKFSDSEVKGQERLF